MLFDADILHHVTLTTQGGGIMQNTADILQITSTIVADNIVQSPSGGANFYVSYGGRTASLLLPAPPGYWLPAVECTIQRDACHYNDKACRIAEARCSLDGSDNVDRCNPSSTSDCALVSERQSCDWRTSPQDLGKTAYVLTQGHYDQAYPFPCAAGLLGGSGSLASEQTTALCAGLCPAGFTCGTEATVVPAVCPPGHYCPAGSTVPLPCPAGRFNSANGSQSMEECTPTDPGFYTSAGSTEQMACRAGTAAPIAGMGACNRCTPGTFQAKAGQVACVACEPGSYCAEGAAAALPCAEGSYSSSTSLTRAAECTLTDQGYYASTGSTQQTPCAAGTAQASSGMGSCSKCAAGTFQDEEGKLTCKPCTAGSYCAEGAAAALPCKAGSYSSSTNLTSAEECTLTDQGHYASTGSTGQTACNPGTYANEPGMPTCTSCEPGRYQPNFKSTRCVLCAVASYCPGFRTTSPTPCPGGTFSNITGLSADWQCTPVEPGFWAPTGSTFPEECPTSGFTCPGRAQDKVNDPPGSKPLLVNSGQASINIKEDIIIFSLALNASLNEYDEDAAIAELATHYKVDASLISVEATPMSYGRRLASNDIMKPDGNLLLRITILVPKASKGKLAAPETLSSRLAELDTPVLFGSSTVLSQNMTISTLSRQESVECPVGYCEACAHQIPTPIKPLPEP